MITFFTFNLQSAVDHLEMNNKAPNIFPEDHQMRHDMMQSNHLHSFILMYQVYYSYILFIATK